MDQTIRQNIERIRGVIAEAARKSGRAASAIRLMAVTKTVDDRRIQEAIGAGIDIVGENYVQEARRKLEIMGKVLEWHMIGHLQTNKAKYAVLLFDMVHSVDRLDLARELDRRAGMAGRTLDVLVEVNLSGEETKSGVPRGCARDLVEAIASLGHLSIRGLMTMPPWFDDAEKARPYFAGLRALRDEIDREGIPRVNLGELSMGMSDDYPVAVEEGSTIVRIGRALFGERPPRNG